MHNLHLLYNPNKPYFFVKFMQWYSKPSFEQLGQKIRPVFTSNHSRCDWLRWFIYYSQKWMKACLLMSGFWHHTAIASEEGGSWGACDHPFVSLFLSKQPKIFRWQKCHDNILATKAIAEKPTFLKFVLYQSINFSSAALVFSQYGLSCHINMSPLMHK